MKIIILWLKLTWILTPCIFFTIPGLEHNCGEYSFRIFLDGFDITPVGFKIYSKRTLFSYLNITQNYNSCVSQKRNQSIRSLNKGRFIEDMNMRNFSLYNYQKYEGSFDPVEEGQWRKFNLTVIPLDVALNTGIGKSFVWTIGELSNDPLC